MTSSKVKSLISKIRKNYGSNLGKISESFLKHYEKLIAQGIGLEERDEFILVSMYKYSPK